MCMIDPDTGVCLGCGRAPEEMSGVPSAPPHAEADDTAQLPDNVRQQVGEGTQ
ncbi:MAG: DUF1289 domain-containing protein [Rhodocyclales bacterium]|nr:DUF1289 domain-containing protein [Rhodocyclales bacterium]